MNSCFQVGEWLVEPDLHSVCRNGQTLHLQPKVMQVLVCLAQHAGEPLSKEELLQAVWQDTFVTDDVLKRAISELRRIFEDKAQESRIIQTIPKRGYRLLAPVRRVGAQTASPDLPAEGAGRRTGGRQEYLTLALASILLTLLAVAAFQGWRKPSAGAASSIARLHVVDSHALDEYIQGNYHLHRFSRGAGDEELKIASAYFQRAIDSDSKFARAYVGMANAHATTFQSASIDGEIATISALTALQLDPNLSDAWITLGTLKANSWDWAEAEADFCRAVALNPDSAQAHQDLADLLDDLGKRDQAWTEYQISQELDPNQEHLEYALYKRHEYDQAINILLTLLANDSNSGYLHHKLYENYSGKGMYKEAIEQLEQTAKLFGFPEVADRLQQAYAVSGYRGAMQAYAAELERMHVANQMFMPINIAAAYAAIGNKDRAFYWLEEGYRRRGHRGPGVPFTEVGVYPGLDPLHADPRFKDLVRRVGF